MITLDGENGSAIIFTHDIENEAIQQIYTFLAKEWLKDCNMRIMPDVHAGKGCVVGFTAKMKNKVDPSLIGVDIGCGVMAWNLGKISLDLKEVDEFIRKSLPSGRNLNKRFLQEEVKYFLGKDFDSFLSEIRKISFSKKYEDNLLSIGSLGGGNHYWELGKDENENIWLSIHSGSRNLGVQVERKFSEIANRRPDITEKIKEIRNTFKGVDIEKNITILKNNAVPKGYLEGEDLEAYIKEMKIAQEYASLNRKVMGYVFFKNFLKTKYIEPIESVHNYINFEDGIMRKGAISAHKGERVVIPLNMAEGVLICTGLGNKEWNFSAPHGAGRKMSRRVAKDTISIEEYEKSMKNVFSSCIGNSTIDEAPQAYKNSDSIIENIDGKTVSVDFVIKPIYNFKASE